MRVVTGWLGLEPLQQVAIWFFFSL
jgi:hypothetical protein